MKSIKTYTDANEALKEIFGYDEFRGAQGDIIENVVKGSDGMVVMATGNGKSLCYQIPAVMSDGLTIVVTPLISLMKDQVDTLLKKGVPAACLYGEQDLSEKQKSVNLLNENKAKLLYVSPEKLLDKDFLDYLATKKIARFAVDEAHCVSLWGRNFRKSYTHLGNVFKYVGDLQNTKHQVIALTATANDLTREDIKNILNLKPDAFEYIGSFDRPNLEFSVRPTKNKMEAALDYIIQHPNEPTIIYSATIKQAEKLQKYLKLQGVQVGLYHGRMKAEEKNKIQDDFMNDDLDVIVATNAFGMGVDKPNVRHVIHLHMPSNIENFYQEAGRLGRDGGPGQSVILYSQTDMGLQTFFIDANYPNPDAVLATRSALATLVQENIIMGLDPSEAITVDKDILSNRATMDLKPIQVDASLKIMEDQGLISINNEIDFDSMNVEINDLEKPLDLSFIAVRKKEMIKRLHQMVRYCVTKACRKDYITTSLGDERKHTNCGMCDNCKNDLELERGNKNKLAEEVITSSITLIKEISETGIVQKSIAQNMLLGVNSLAIKARRWDENKSFGSLKNWSKDDVSALMDHLIENNLLEIDKNNRITLGKAGVDWLNGSKSQISAPDSLKHKGIVNNEKSVVSSGKSKPSDNSLVNIIENWRKRMSVEGGIPETWILNDDHIKKIAEESFIGSKEKLESIGMPSKTVKKFGDSLLSELKIYYSHQQNEYTP